VSAPDAERVDVGRTRWYASGSNVGVCGQACSRAGPQGPIANKAYQSRLDLAIWRRHVESNQWIRSGRAALRTVISVTASKAVLGAWYAASQSQPSTPQRLCARR